MKGKQSSEKVNNNIDISGVYDEYNNDYIEKAKSNTKIEPQIQFPIEAQSYDTSFQKVMKRKWCVIGAAIVGMVVVALVVGLPLYFLLYPYTYSKCHDITNSTIANSTSSISTLISPTSTTMLPTSTTLSPTSTSPPTTTISPPTTTMLSCIWTSWVDASRCHFDQNVGNGFRLRTRCCATQNGSDNLDSCNDERDVMECSPRECIDLQCNCNLSSESFGLKNGICSGKNLKICFDYGCDHLSNPKINSNIKPALIWGQ